MLPQTFHENVSVRVIFANPKALFWRVCLLQKLYRERLVSCLSLSITIGNKKRKETRFSLEMASVLFLGGL